MAKRSRTRTPTRLPKTLTGLITAIVLAVLAALGVKTDWFHGKPSAPTATPPTPTVATGDLPRTYVDHRLTFYCGCTYSADRQIDLESCGLTPLADKPLAKRIDAEHLFPASQFGNFRSCWREPGDFPECVKSSGKTVSGRECCQRVDPVFEAAHNDLMNLVPAVGQINVRRKDYNWGMIPGEQRDYGRCNIEIDSSIRRAEPPETVMGDIARTMFYMEATYGFRLSNQDRQLYTAWSKQDPPDAWETERARRIQAIQGQGNPFVTQYTTIFGKTASAPAAPAAPSTAPVPTTPAPAVPADSGWTCGSKTTCGEMESCEEAKFYLTQCGVSRLDGDGDGMPCTSLCRR